MVKWWCLISQGTFPRILFPLAIALVWICNWVFFPLDFSCSKIVLCITVNCYIYCFEFWSNHSNVGPLGPLSSVLASPFLSPFHVFLDFCNALKLQAGHQSNFAPFHYKFYEPLSEFIWSGMPNLGIISLDRKLITVPEPWSFPSAKPINNNQNIPLTSYRLIHVQWSMHKCLNGPSGIGICPISNNSLPHTILS